MPAESKKQQNFFGLVRAVQKGKTKANKVGAKVVRAAKDVSAGVAGEFAKSAKKATTRAARVRAIMSSKRK